MPISYTNRKGSTFFLCQGETKTGKVRYYFSRESRGKKIEKIPIGYEISESVNGVVSLVKVRPRLIPMDEAALVENALKRHPNGSNYRVDVKQSQIVIYEGTGPDVDGILNLFGDNFPRSSGATNQIKAQLERYIRFAAVMRFTLNDPDKRTFYAERWCHFGSVDDWIRIGRPEKLDQLVIKLIPTLGTDDFYELY